MGKINNYLKATNGSITNGEVINNVVTIIGLMTMGFVLNKKLYDARMDNISKDIKIETLKGTKADMREKIISQDFEICNLSGNINS